MKIIHLHELEHRQLQSPPSGEFYSLSSLVSEQLGARQVFLVHDILEPGRKASNPHRHSRIEEVIYVLKGAPTLIHGGQKHPLSEGSFVFFDPIQKELHTLVNETPQGIETLTFSTERSGDTVLTGISDQHPIGYRPPVLETPRLILRALDVSDAKAVFAYARNPNVCKLTLWEAHQSIEDSERFIKDYAEANYAQGVPEPFGIAFKSDPETIIGTAGCFWSSKPARAMELAYALAEPHWGKGIAAEASKSVMEHCFREFRLKRIQARCKVQNASSARVLEKIGMKLEGTLRASVFHRGQYWDMHHYSRLAED
jgi:ribosomal-protein-alanine N-acetyltransferase